MENRINQLMCLADGRKYAIMKQAIYKGVNYFVAARATDDEEDLKEEFEVFKEVDFEGAKAVEKVEDTKLIELICKNVGLYEG